MNRAKSIAQDALIWMGFAILFIGWAIAMILGMVCIVVMDCTGKAIDWVKEKQND